MLVHANILKRSAHALKRKTHVRDSEYVIRVPNLDHSPLRDQDQIDHEPHQSPAQDNGQGALNPPLLALLRRLERVNDICVGCFVFRLDAWRQRLVGLGRAKERVRQGKGDEAGDGQDEEGKELALSEDLSQRLLEICT